MKSKKKNLPMLIIVEEDDDLSKSLALVFSDKFDVRIENEFSSFKDEPKSACYFLIDANIVEKKGMDFLISIREDNPNAIIILMDKAEIKKSEYHALYKQYSNAVVFKPFDAESILKLINRLGSKKTDLPAYP